MAHLAAHSRADREWVNNVRSSVVLIGRQVWFSAERTLRVNQYVLSPRGTPIMIPSARVTHGVTAVTAAPDPESSPACSGDRAPRLFGSPSPMPPNIEARAVGAARSDRPQPITCAVLGRVSGFDVAVDMGDDRCETESVQPDLMYRVSPEVPGGFGETTILDSTIHPPTVTRLHFVFAGWMGDDLVESFPCHLASERLRNAIETAELSGLAFTDVVVEVDEQAELFDPGLAERLPTWWWLKPAQEKGGDFWQDALAQLFVSGRALDVLQQHNLTRAEVTLRDV